MVGPIQYQSNNPYNFLNMAAFETPCTSLSGTALTDWETSGTGPDQNCVPGTRHFGNEGRNSLRGPSFKQWDFAVFKNTQLTEWLGMELRAEFFNFLNHPNFSNPLLPAFIADAGQQGKSETTGVSPGCLSAVCDRRRGIGNPFLGGGRTAGDSAGGEVHVTRRHGEAGVRSIGDLVVGTQAARRPRILGGRRAAFLLRPSRLKAAFCKCNRIR